MLELVSYTNPLDFLKSQQFFLEEREIEHNLLIGLCLEWLAHPQLKNDAIFLSVQKNGTTLTTVISRNKKPIISGATILDETIEIIAKYFIENKIEIIGVNAEIGVGEKLARTLQKGNYTNRGLIVHELKDVVKTKFSDGELRLATLDDLPIVSVWVNAFFDGFAFFSKENKNAAVEFAQHVIGKNDLYVLHFNNKLLSMAGVVRRTRNIGIVGLVYTPNDFRGKGYASTCVQKLSNEIFNSGLKACGLFTEKDNPTSNKIYKSIGYVAGAEFVDITFN